MISLQDKRYLSMNEKAVPTAIVPVPIYSPLLTQSYPGAIISVLFDKAKEKCDVNIYD